jgi:hypothetical protein
MACEKIEHTTYKSAQDHIKGLVIKQAGTGTSYRSYKCTACGFFHVTSISKKKLCKDKDQKYKNILSFHQTKTLLKIISGK